MHRTVVVCLLLAWCRCAFALNPALDASQYAHTSWKIRDGFTRGRIGAIAQTLDGYLWLGTEFGLVRFDGVRAVPRQPPAGESLPHGWVRSLIAARDGTLWIGTLGGLASLKNGKLTQYPDLAGMSVDALLEDHDGTVWSSGLAARGVGAVCSVRGARIRCQAEDIDLGHFVTSLSEAGDYVWAAAGTGLWRWAPGPPKLNRLPDQIAATFKGLIEGDNKALLISTRHGILRFADDKAETFSLPNVRLREQVSALLRDRDGGLWVGTVGRGLLHVHDGRTDSFDRMDGLSGSNVKGFFEDREGSVWVSTIDGLDRFRGFAASTFAASPRLSNYPAGAVLAGKDGSVWVSYLGGLNRWQNGHIADPKAVREVVRIEGPDRSTGSLFQDTSGRVWLGAFDRFGYVEHDRFVSEDSIPGGFVNAIVEDAAKNIWIAHQTLGLFRLAADRQVQQTAWSAMGHGDGADRIAADSTQGGIWLGFHRGGIARLADGHIRETYTPADGLGGGRVNDLRVDRDGTVWAATEGGLSRLKHGRIATLTAANGLPCDAVDSTLDDGAGSVWLYLSCGLARIARPELDKWAAAADIHREAGWTIHATFLDTSDGVRSAASVSSYSPHATRLRDGTLWFASPDGVTVVDPAHLPFNSLPPPVHIEGITADRKTYETSPNQRLPPLVRDLEIDYTALSLVAPEKNRFKVKLEGWDREWQDVGNRRQAFYNNLPPRNYRFRVIASNNSAVWNEAGASLEFGIAPAYYQTLWFRLTMVAAAGGLLVALYQLRLRRLAWQFNMRLEERVNERTRVARDLHDTLLQSFHAVLLRLRGTTFLLDRPDDARKTLNEVIDDASDAITEARDAVQGLRASSDPTTTLVEAIAALAKELEAEDARPSRPQFTMHVEGTPGVLQPLVRDDVYRVAREVLRNAFHHANATQIEADLRYDRRQFRLRIRDDGKGIDGRLLESGRSGHFGLAGMRERAELLGGTFTLWSEPGSGTEVELTIPASVAYSKE